MLIAGSWSVYWYNGVIVSSEIARGLDIFELVRFSGLVPGLGGLQAPYHRAHRIESRPHEQTLVGIG